MPSMGFNTNTVEPDSGQLPALPDGWYQMNITGCELAMAKSADAGEMVVMEFEPDVNTHPELKGRKVKSWFCKDHTSQQTRDIARRQLSAVAHAIERPDCENTEDYLGGDLMVRLKQGSREGFNDCAAYARTGEHPPVGKGPQKAATAAPAKAAPAAAQTKLSANGRPAWKK